MLTLYVIKSCDTCRRARKALDSLGLEYHLHDLRGDGLTASMLDTWLSHVPALDMLNKRSTTWRSLDEHSKASIDTDSARQLMLEHPTLIKRPLLDTGDTIMIGYRDGDYDELSG
ncbi:Spx/MgsR family RNA polymerase-binding regulatory protein [Aidingimonas halophila]|uniref:Transcriptional regulator, Spx/MgsR family n=1 Tax=Aidingimonas halophila TaxID=574349 RepID=A0A1H2VKQ3_9GAMM|nr:Spx/MgsR family RNA polymerase-binding regulatory protein [Aidingimonas halophila]GHC24467.1 hypothetical protein GCM10008094_14410 [Aidingimonas halophila]SDW68877.1 transcriptional regulator, Spx/MgsR family [Aidingimonas halophila]